MVFIRRAEPVPMTERTIQSALARLCAKRQHDLWVPNCSTVFGWESDLASVTKSGLAHDHEIKISRADWLRELRTKERRHRHLQEARERARRILEQRNGRTSAHYPMPPNYWWLVCPDGVAKEDEIPDYAGWMEVRNGLDGAVTLRIKKEAPRLHTHKVSVQTILAIGRGICFRFWEGVWTTKT